MRSLIRHRRAALFGTLAVTLALPLAVAAQSASPRGQETGPLEIRRGERESTTRKPVVKSEHGVEVREAERSVAEYEQRQREQSTIREQTRRPAPRPDLGYDVSTSIQQRAVPRSPAR
jgi:hypothetical protein